MENYDVRHLEEFLTRGATQPKNIGSRSTSCFKTLRALQVIVFSKDRALQLDAVLRSLYRCCEELDEADLTVLFKTDQYLSQYASLAREHDRVTFTREVAFDKQLFQAIATHEQILFLVDDILFTRKFHLSDIDTSLNRDDVLSFQLHMGRNVTYCYPLDCPIEGFILHSLAAGTYQYDWRSTNIRYPFDVSASAYRSDILLSILANTSCDSPHKLESRGHDEVLRRELGPYIACYERSVCFSNPINVVNPSPPNRVATVLGRSVQELAQKYEDGAIVDVERYLGLQTDSTHFEAPLYLKNIQRKRRWARNE